MKCCRSIQRDEVYADMGSEEPFNIFGHGVLSFFTMIESIIYVIFACTLLVLPVIYIYHSGNRFNEIA